MTRVKHYGIHKDQVGVMHLLQGNDSGNFIGLTSPPPFSVKLPFNKSCPHAISLADVTVDKSHWKLFQALLEDPLVYEMLPIPKGRGAPTLYFNSLGHELLLTLVTLSRLGSPVYQAVQPMTNFSHKLALEELAMTNITPLILTGVKPEHQMAIEKIVHEALLLPRRLILLGDPTVVAAGSIKREVTNIRAFEDCELARLPMESLGAIALRQFARGEIIGGDNGKRKRPAHV